MQTGGELSRRCSGRKGLCLLACSSLGLWLSKGNSWGCDLITGSPELLGIARKGLNQFLKDWQLATGTWERMQRS